MDMSRPEGFEDWEKWPAEEPFEDMAGPFFFKKTPEGYVAGFRSERKHMNGGGAIHGGMLMTFADYALFAIATDELAGTPAVTISLNGEFTSAGSEGAMVIARGEVVRNTGSMVFVRGVIEIDGDVLLNFSGIVRKLRKRAA